METQYSKKRVQDFIEISKADPIRRCEEFMVNLRKERFRERSRQHRYNITKIKGICSKKELMCIGNNWNKYRYYQPTVEEEHRCKQEAESIIDNIVKNYDYTEMGEVIDHLNEVTYDHTEETDREVLCNIKILRIVLAKKNCSFNPEMQQYLISALINILEKFRLSRFGFLDIQYEAISLLMQFTAHHKMDLSIIRQLKKINVLPHCDILVVMINLCCDGKEAVIEVFETFDVPKMIEDYISNIETCFCKFIDEYRKNGIILDISTAHCDCACNLELVKERLLIFASLCKCLTAFTSSFVKEESLIYTQFKEFLKASIVYMKNALDIPLKPDEKLLTSKLFLLESLSCVIAHIEDGEILDSICDSHFEDSLSKIIIENTDHKLIEEALDLITDLPASSKFIVPLQIVCSKAPGIEFQMVNILINFISSGDEELLTELFTENITNALLNYMISDDMELQLLTYKTLKNVCDEGYADILDKEFIKYAIDELNNPNKTPRLILYILGFIDRYLQADEVEEGVYFYNTVSSYQGLEKIFELQDSENYDISQKSQRIIEKRLKEFD
ncbi:unnamed protein product [Moneuplotes crassus]|uniref:Uncharacterized protein n=1 Tax=Euplotes crassus TaxID=5936 RepID=A0AAD1U635_EUPCR|nr:unnamed protein product [Moneuplotes crassus]